MPLSMRRRIIALPLVVGIFGTAITHMVIGLWYPV